MSEPLPAPVLGPWRDGEFEWTRDMVVAHPHNERHGLTVSKRAGPAGFGIEVWRGGYALGGWYAPTLALARDMADAEARKRGMVLLDADPQSLSGQSGSAPCGPDLGAGRGLGPI